VQGVVNSEAEHRSGLWISWLSEALIYQPSYFSSFLPNPFNVDYVHTQNMFGTMQESEGLSCKT